MIVKCEINDLRVISEETTKKRLYESIHLDNLSEYFEVGQQFQVQALENMWGGIWVYLHVDDDDSYPRPFPAEFFSVVDNSIVEGWGIKWFIENGAIKIKRLSFKEWVEDDFFYEKLLNGDVEASNIYMEWLKKR